MILEQPTITLALRIEGNITPKARPRVTRGQAYLPPRYREWKEQAVIQLQDQLPTDHEPIKKAAIYVTFYGSLRGDLDNLAGSILDSLVQAQAITDDRLSVISKLNISHSPSQIKGCTILIEELT